MSPITRDPFAEMREAEARRQDRERLRQQEQRKVIGVSSGEERPTIDIEKAKAETQRGTQLRQQEKLEKLATNVRQIKAGKVTQKQKNIYDSLAELNKVIAGDVSIKTSDAKMLKKIQEGQIKQVQEQFNEVQKNRDKYLPGVFQTYNQKVGQYLKDANENLDSLNKAIEQGTVTKAQLKTQIKQLQEEALKPILKKTYTYKTLPEKLPTEEEKQRNKAIDSLLKSGLAKRVGNTITLTKDYRGFTDRQIKTAQQAGFNVSDEENLSFSILEYGEKNLKGRSKRLTEYASVVVGSGEKVYTDTIGAFVSFIQSKPNTKNRSVTPETISYVRNLSKSDKIYLGIGAWGSEVLSNYGVMVPVGTALTGVFKGAASIARTSGLKSPAAVSRIANEIAKHPKLAQAVLLAPIAGVEASEVYEQYKAGVPIDKILSNEALRVGNLYAQIKGLEAGFKLPGKVEQWWKTRNRIAIPPEELFRAVTLETGELPSYKGARKTWSKQFTDLAKLHPAESYLGEVAPGELRLWHGRPTPFPGEEVIATGTKYYPNRHGEGWKLYGLYLSPEPSPLRLGGPASGAGSSRLGIPGLAGTRELVTLDCIVDIAPSNLSPLGPKGTSEAQMWFNKQVGLKTAYIPPVSLITTEMEAVLPPGTKLIKVNSDYYINWAGHRVLVNQYVVVSEEIAKKLIIPAGGFTDIEAILRNSADLSISEKYLYFGIPPPSISSLSSEQITQLAKYYGVSESEVRSLGLSLKSTLEDIKSLKTSSKPVELSDLKLVLDEPSTGITSITVTPPTEPPSPPTEPPSTPEEPPSPTEEPAPTTISKKGVEQRRKLNLSMFYGKKMLYEATYDFKGEKSQTIGPIEARSLYDACQRAQRLRRTSKKLPYKGSIVLIGETKG